jgi:tetratricopeptide (TPR) repeat protein
MKALNNFKIGQISIATILFSTLAALPIALNFHIGRADALITEDVRGFTQNPLARTQPNVVGGAALLAEPLPQQKENLTEVADGHKAQSLEYVQRGWNAQKRGDAETAIGYYQQALEVDPENAYAFAAVAMLVGHCAEGHTLMQTAVELFDKQGNLDGCAAANEWLNEGN